MIQEIELTTGVPTGFNPGDMIRVIVPRVKWWRRVLYWARFGEVADYYIIKEVYKSKSILTLEIQLIEPKRSLFQKIVNGR